MWNPKTNKNKIKQNKKTSKHLNLICDPGDFHFLSQVLQLKNGNNNRTQEVRKPEIANINKELEELLVNMCSVFALGIIVTIFHKISLSFCIVGR